jgi:hypothetical protein
MHLGIVTGCFHWRWAIIAANYLLSVLTIEAKHLIHFSFDAILETGLEQPHLTVGFFWKPGAIMRVAPPSEKVCCHPNGQDRFTGSLRLQHSSIGWDARFQVTPQLN